MSRSKSSSIWESLNYDETSEDGIPILENRINRSSPKPTKKKISSKRNRASPVRSLSRKETSAREQLREEETILGWNIVLEDENNNGNNANNWGRLQDDDADADADADADDDDDNNMPGVAQNKEPLPFPQWTPYRGVVYTFFI
jgi:hypothetical protein